MQWRNIVKEMELKTNIRNNICHCDLGELFYRCLLPVKKGNKYRGKKMKAENDRQIKRHKEKKKVIKKLHADSMRLEAVFIRSEDSLLWCRNSHQRHYKTSNYVLF
jgi:hypothetical protein